MLTRRGAVVFWTLAAAVLGLAVIGGVTVGWWAATGCWGWSCV